MSKLSEKPSANLAAPDPAPQTPEFSLEQRRTLLRIAHRAILSVLERQPFPEPPRCLPSGCRSRAASSPRFISPAISTANFEDASAMPRPSRLCIAPSPKRPAPPLSKIPASCR